MSRVTPSLKSIELGAKRKEKMANGKR